MTIQYCSDLHLEVESNKKWLRKHPLEVKGEILLLGGDIMPLNQQAQHDDFIDFVAANYKAVYWIPGNHEYDHSDINTYTGSFNRAVRENVFLVNNTTIQLNDNIALICSTLWSQINRAHADAIVRSISDFRVITDGDSKLQMATYNKLHEEAVRFLKEAITSARTRHKIVLTHHVPTFVNYPAKHTGYALNQAFATELQDLIIGSGISYWLYGHTHTNTPSFVLGNTQLCTNQLGYIKHGKSNGFDRGRTLVVV